MDEHTMGVKINDQTAHYQKVLEEVRIANGELSKTFAQIAEAKQQYEDAVKQLINVKADIALANSKLETVTQECEARDKNSRQLADQAASERDASKKLLSDTYEVASQIISDAQGSVVAINEEYNRIDGFVDSYRSIAEELVSNVGSLEQTLEDLKTTEKYLRASIEDERSLHFEQMAQNRSELDSLKEEIVAAKEILEKTRAETARFFENLDRRERAVSVKENDLEIMRGRLRAIIQAKLKE